MVHPLTHVFFNKLNIKMGMGGWSILFVYLLFRLGYIEHWADPQGYGTYPAPIIFKTRECGGGGYSSQMALCVKT